MKTFIKRQFRAMFTKRLIHGLRHPVNALIQILIPIAVTVVACLVRRVPSDTSSPPEFVLNLDGYDDPVASFRGWLFTKKSNCNSYELLF